MRTRTNSPIMRATKTTMMNNAISIKALLIGIAVLLAASSVVASAAVKVTNLTMEKMSQFTELTVVCDGPAEFEHQIVKATDDKPYRIVVDVKGAVHALPQHNFSALPSGTISRIRTSQFSSDPDVVRIVVDAASKLTYKVKGGNNTFTLDIATPTDDNFTLWSAVPVSQTPELAQAKVVTGQPTKPAGMPAIEGNEANAPKVDYSDPAKKDLRLGSKPPVESGSGNAAAGDMKQEKKDSPKMADSMAQPKSSGTTSEKMSEQKPEMKSASTAATKESEQMPAVAKPSSVPDMATPDLLTFVYGDTSSKSTAADKPADKAADKAASKPAGKSAEKQSAEMATAVKQETPKAGSEMPASSMSGNSMSGNSMSAKSTSDKTSDAAAEMKSAKKSEQAPATTPKMAQADKMMNDKPNAAEHNEKPGGSEIGEVADAFANEPVNDEARAKSDKVREKYRSNLQQQNAQEPAGKQDTAESSAQSSGVPKSKIDRIREKYKRGIKFAVDEQDERRQEYLDEQETEDFADTQRNVGPYNEFLPEREIVVYNSGGRVDPFAPLIEDAVAASEPQRLPDVEALRLVGVLLDEGDDRGLFQDFNGYYYILREGDSVKNGYLLSIAEDRATFQIRQYGWNRQVALDLENKY